MVRDDVVVRVQSLLPLGRRGYSIILGNHQKSISLLVTKEEGETIAAIIRGKKCHSLFVSLYQDFVRLFRTMKFLLMQAEITTFDEGILLFRYSDVKGKHIIKIHTTPVTVIAVALLNESAAITIPDDVFFNTPDVADEYLAIQESVGRDRRREWWKHWQASRRTS